MLSSELYKPRGHEIQITRHFGAGAIYEGPTIFKNPLNLLCFSNRSGSNLLAEYLNSTGVFAGFGESLNSELVVKSSIENKFQSFADYIIAVENGMQRRGPHTGFKANWTQLLMLYRLGITKLYPSVKVFHILRRNLLDQAISFSIAWQTKKWAINQKKIAEPVYDYEDIDMRLHGSALSKEAIRHICLLFDIPNVEVTYEELISDPKAVLIKIFEFVGEGIGSWSPKETTLKTQRDEINAEYRRKFLDEARKRALSAA